MKKYLLYTVFFLASAVGASALPLEIFNQQDTVIGTIHDEELICYAQIRNTSDAEVEFGLSMDFVELTSGHVAAVCWNQCFDFTDQVFISPWNFKMDAGAESGPTQFSGHLMSYKLISSEPLLYTNPVAGTTIVRYTFFPIGDENGGKLEHVVVFKVTDPASIDNDLKYRISEIYPNPSSDLINIEFDDDVQSNLTASIYDISGNLMYSTDIVSGTTIKSMDVTNLQNGTYYLSIRKGNLLRNMKFTVSR
ncbi:MAG: T9SS type A sorting domain-containing protein [Candidatus Kapaibacterium sp.]|jgi:hypothetical protein|nr:T9SS type A sorting domain-containing protein [Candidatus Kapabacteria bacterium]